MITIRVQQGIPEQDQATGLWRTCFELWRGAPGSERLETTAHTAYIYQSEDEALEYGNRALEYFQEHNLTIPVK